MSNHCVRRHFDPIVLIHHRGPLSVSRMYKQLQHKSTVVLFGYVAGSITFPRSEMNVMVLVIRDYFRRAFRKHSNPADAYDLSNTEIYMKDECIPWAQLNINWFISGRQVMLSPRTCLREASAYSRRRQSGDTVLLWTATTVCRRFPQTSPWA